MKKLFKPSAVVLFFLFGMLNANAQEVESKHALGAGAGFTTGYGISYRYTPNRIGVQVNFAPYKTKEKSMYSTGITFIYSLMKTEKTNLYLYQANHYFSSSESVKIYGSLTPPNLLRTEKKDEAYFNNGIGFGMEFIVASKVGLNFMTGYASYKNFEEFMMTGEFAIYFKF